jgi:hypothetical protein
MQQMGETECQRWASKGINITYQIRENMTGYRAGTLKEGLKRSYIKHCNSGPKGKKKKKIESGEVEEVWRGPVKPTLWSPSPALLLLCFFFPSKQRRFGDSFLINYFF